MNELTTPRATLLLLIAVGACAAALDAGCGGDDTSPAAPDASVRDVTAQDVTVGNDATADSSPADTGAADASADADASIDSGPPFDCTHDFPDAGADAAQEPPLHLQCTGLYTDDGFGTTIAPDVQPFAPGLVLWSDGAQKSRWVHLPTGQKIDTTNPDEWVFPVGTKFFKEFKIGGKRIETRLFWKVAAGTWARTTYQWSADDSTATRLDDGANRPSPDAGLLDDGGVEGGLDGAATYEIPTVQQCDTCHAGRLDKILGFEAISLGVPGATGLTLSTLKNQGLLVESDGGPTTLPDSFTIPEDSTGNARASIGWLHANCGTICHNQNPQAFCNFISMRLRLNVSELTAASPAVTDLDVYQTTHDKLAVTDLGDPNVSGYKRIAPGDLPHSLISYLIGRRTANEQFGQMPFIDSHIVDVKDVSTLNAWITNMQ